jgi:hypothetical protein
MMSAKVQSGPNHPRLAGERRSHTHRVGYRRDKHGRGIYVLSMSESTDLALAGKDYSSNGEEAHQ